MNILFGALLNIDLGGLKLWFNMCKNLFPLIKNSKEVQSPGTANNTGP
jgi:hypothetical protein